jgi:integrase/recombinase XerD
MSDYKPPRLRTNEDRWDIIYYLEGQRIRVTFGMNRIKDLKERKEFALEKLREVRAWLKAGAPKNEPDRRVNVVQALHLAMEVKFLDMRENSKRSYRSICKSLVMWLVMNKLDYLDANEITRQHAIDHLDWVVKHQGIGGRTYNNRLIHLKSLWNELIHRGYCKLNPWAEVRRKKESDKTRRPLRPGETDEIFTAIMGESQYLGLAVLLIYYCMIRPAEILRMKVGMVNMAEGVIYLPPDVTKNRRRANITIPEVLSGWIRQHFDLSKMHPGYYLIGEGMKPGRLPCSPNTMNKKHKAIVTRLHRAGKLADISGVQLYSWKDTGVKKLLDRGVNIVEIMHHLRHQDLNVTQRYCTSLQEISPNIQQLDDTIPGIKA